MDLAEQSEHEDLDVFFFSLFCFNWLSFHDESVGPVLPAVCVRSKQKSFAAGNERTLKACWKVERASASVIESRHVLDKCFDQPLTSFIEKSRFTFRISAPELRRDGIQRENVPKPVPGFIPG